MTHGWRSPQAGLSGLWRLVRPTPIALAATILVASHFGCIERTVSIQTEPDGALVYLNDEEVGRSPVRVPFTWYGDYDIVIRKTGYKTLQTNHRINTPWYQIPGIDVITECLVPFTVHDDRVLDTFILEAREPVDKQALLESSVRMRQETVSGVQ